MRNACLATATGIAALLSIMIVPSSTETAIANGDTRTLNLYHSHTGESIQATFRSNGSYDPAVLEQLNYFLRDWRNNDRTRMDPRLFDVIWEAYRTAGATQPIVIVSAYRSPETNAMLRSRSHAVAEHSQHILGRAMDTTMPGMPMERIREIGMRLQRGGVGWYPSANFVHLDVGGVRAWPRMSYDQLVRLFPDGKTVHLAADGRMLPRYQEARAEIASRGGIMSDVAQAAPSGGGLFAWLFGKHDDERGEEKEAEAAKPEAVRPGRARHGETEAASLHAPPPPTTEAAPANSVAAAAPVAPVAVAVSIPAPEKNAPGAPNLTSTNRTRVAGLDPSVDSRDTIAAVAGQELNAATPSKLGADKRGAGSIHVPLPPLRPALSGDTTLAFASVPTPPARPASLIHLAALTVEPAQGKDSAPVSKNGMKSAAAPTITNTPLARAANLPVLITQGAKAKDRGGVPSRVLAFASDTPVQDTSAETSKTPGQPLGQSTPQPAAAGLDRAKSHGLASVSFQTPSILGPSFTGLRRAARNIPGALSNTPSVKYVSAFSAATANNPDTGHFTGVATKPVTLEQGNVPAGDVQAPLRGK